MRRPCNVPESLLSHGLFALSRRSDRFAREKDGTREHTRAISLPRNSYRLITYNTTRGVMLITSSTVTTAMKKSCSAFGRVQNRQQGPHPERGAVHAQRQLVSHLRFTSTLRETPQPARGGYCMPTILLERLRVCLFKDALAKRNATDCNPGIAVMRITAGVVSEGKGGTSGSSERLRG